MTRFALAILALASIAAPAAAENLNCERDYKAFWERMRNMGAKMSATELADTNRVAARGYDACTSGDERFDAKKFFENLGSPGSKSPAQIFADSERHGSK